MRVFVVSSTGAQGGAVARHLLSTGKYQVRCLTRRPDSNAAMALQRLGAQIVVGDLDDTASLRTAMRGCDVVFGVTNYWEHFQYEFEQARHLIDAITTCDVQHAILSTLPYAKQLSGGRMEVAQFDTKARIEEYARLRNVPATYLHTAFYFENFLHHFLPLRQADGRYVFGFPQGSTALAGVSMEDIGGIVAGILAEAFWYRDKVVGVVGDELPCEQYAQIMSRLLGRTIEYRHIAHDEFAKLDLPRAKDLADMFEFTRRFVSHRTGDLVKSRELYPEIRTFEIWLKSHAASMEQKLSEQNDQKFAAKARRQEASGNRL